MKQITIPHVVVAALVASLFCGAARAQGEQTAPPPDKRSVPKFEIGAQFSHLYDSDVGSFGSAFGNPNVPPGFGGRVTYNFTDHLAAEAEANFFPFRIDGDAFVGSGRALQAQFGVKAGKRFRHFGVFAKARPGFISFDETLSPRVGEPFIALDGSQVIPIEFSLERKTHLALDVGGVVEVYASRRFFARFDAGDTIIRYGSYKDFNFIAPSSTDFISAPARTSHNLQITAGAGVRLGSRGGGDSGAAAGSRAARPEKATRFEAGAQFTSLSFTPITQLSFGIPLAGSPETETQLGFGGRITYNLTGYLALEAETNLLPRKFTLGIGASGRVTQGQFGVKAGRRFHSFGVFAKARPGFVSFSSSFKQVGLTPPFPNSINGSLIQLGIFAVGRRTFFSTDVGGVLELYPSRRWLVRFDGGDTVIRYGERSVSSFSTLRPINVAPPETRHNLQLSTGVGFRF
jgi:hypothetical protein